MIMIVAIDDDDEEAKTNVKIKWSFILLFSYKFLQKFRNSIVTEK